MSSAGYIIFFALLCILPAYSKKIPSYITLCHRNDPDLEGCVRNAIEQIRPHLTEGVPELLLPPLNPLVLPEAGLDSGNNFHASFKNIHIYYANEFKVDRLKIDLDNFHIELGLSFPKLRIKSEYNVDGRILILQLHGRGPADGNLTDVTAELTADGYRQQRKGKEYIAITGITKLNLNLGKPVFHFDNVFQNNQELNAQTNRVINENVVELVDELKPLINKVVMDFAQGVVGRIFDRYSFDELFPN